jgi:hypothetical protein
MLRLSPALENQLARRVEDALNNQRTLGRGREGMPARGDAFVTVRCSATLKHSLDANWPAALLSIPSRSTMPWRRGLITQKDINERLQRASERPFATAVKHAPAYAAVRAWDIARRAGDKQDEADAAEAILTHIKSGSISRMPQDEFDSISPILKDFLSQTAQPQPTPAPSR